MHKVTKAQMDEVIACLQDPAGRDHGAVFNTLSLNPYDHCQNGGELEFNVVVHESNILDAIQEIQDYPEEGYEILSEERQQEIEEGAKLTQKEQSLIRDKFIETSREAQDAEYAVVSKLSDGSREVYLLYTEMMCGQGGIQIIDFLGFYESEGKTRSAMNSLSGSIVV